MRIIRIEILPATEEERAKAAAREATGALREIARDKSEPSDVRIEAAEAILRHFRHFFN